MRSDKQMQASKNNGSKSLSPVTDQGKATSAQNASSHNLASLHLVLLSNEDPADFELHESGFLHRFQPVDSVEYDLVQKMIIASWRERRIAIMESSLFELEMERQRFTVDTEFSELGPGPRQVLALFGTSDAAAASSLLLRYGATARRAFASAFRILRDLQGDRFNRTPNVLPAPTHPAATSEPSSAKSNPGTPITASQPEAIAVAYNRARSSLTLVRRQDDRHKFQSEMMELPNEPKTAAAAATPGSHHVALNGAGNAA